MSALDALGGLCFSYELAERLGGGSEVSHALDGLSLRKALRLVEHIRLFGPNACIVMSVRMEGLLSAQKQAPAPDPAAISPPQIHTFAEFAAAEQRVVDFLSGLIGSGVVDLAALDKSTRALMGPLAARWRSVHDFIKSRHEFVMTDDAGVLRVSLCAGDQEYVLSCTFLLFPILTMQTVLGQGCANTWHPRASNFTLSLCSPMVSTLSPISRTVRRLTLMPLELR